EVVMPIERPILFRLVCCVLFVAAAFAIPRPASAGTADDLPRIALHATSLAFKNPCGYRPNTEALTTHQPTLPFEARNVFVLVCNGPTAGISGLQFGVDYPGVFNREGDPEADMVVYAFASCAYLSFDAPGWPAPGTGTLLAWNYDECQLLDDTGGGTFANAGYFYLSVYRPGTLRITPRPSDGRASLVDCSNVSYNITNVLDGGLLGSVGFGPDAGYNPCAASVSVTPTTWSAIKRLD
ncbi:MAG TPA: hypothetical protein VF720_05065, partial [Candidatus Eisenbacteria bacterium]